MNAAKPVILVCDDEKGVRESLKIILSDDYGVLFAENGLEALEMIKSNTPQAMLLDLKMPKMHGLEILKTSSQIEAFPAHFDCDLLSERGISAGSPETGSCGLHSKTF
jgi:CheY-like chemotaxis protein